MDDIIFYCAKCDAKLSAGTEEVGLEFQCPKCNAMQIVPEVPGSPEDVKRVTTRLSAVESSVKSSAEDLTQIPSVSHVRIPKKTIILSSKLQGSEEEGREYFEEIGGSSLSLFAVALGTVGFSLCALSLTWAVLSLQKSNTDWWMMLLLFTSTFLSGLMGLGIAQLARLLVRIGDRLDQLEYD